MEIHSLLCEFGRVIGLDSVVLDARGTCRLIIDKDLVVDLEISKDGKLLHLIATLGPLPAAADTGLMRGLLAANFMGQETGSAVLALDELNNEIVLCQRLPVDALDVHGLVDELESFVNRTEEWKQRLEEGFRTRDSAGNRLPPDSIPFVSFA